jgi:hypothetical protein
MQIVIFSFRELITMSDGIFSLTRMVKPADDLQLRLAGRL